jgi:WD40 repeat protein
VCVIRFLARSLVASARAGGRRSAQALLERRSTLHVRAHRGPALGAAFSPDGQTIVSVGTDAVRAWDVLGTRLLPVHLGAMGPDGSKPVLSGVAFNHCDVCKYILGGWGRGLLLFWL